MQYRRIVILIKNREISIPLAKGVSATAFRWNRAGKVNAIGVQVRAPTMDKNLSSLSPSRIVKQTVKNTRMVLEWFLKTCLFLDFYHPA